MKKVLLTIAFFLVVVVINAQSLEDIINKYTVANKLDKITDFKTLKITGKTSVMGMDMPVEIWMKSPNKIKSVSSFNGQDIIQVFDGEKGYMVNPMTGSAEPVEMTADQVKSASRNNMFNNYMAEYLKEGKLTLEGEDNINGKPAFKIKAAIGESSSATVFIDKSTYLILKTVANGNQGGMAITMEAFPTDYSETNGILLPMKTTMSTNGMEIVTTYTKVEVDVPIEDSVFKIK
jgi:outer membrane lipoprotein-sorting protein